MKGKTLFPILALSLAFVFLANHAAAASFDLQVTPSIISTCPCSSITPQYVQVSVRNLYQYPDTFSFVIDAPPGFSPQVQQSLVINAGDTRKLDLFLINVGCNVVPGDYQVTVKARSGTTGDTLTKTLAVEVLNCYDVQLNIEGKYKEMCIEENGTAIYYLVVDNRGKYSDTYTLTSSVTWASFSDTVLTIEAGKSKSVALALTPPANMRGVQTVNVQVKSQKFYSSDSDTVQLTIQDCYGMAADLQPTETTVCLGEIVTQKLTISNTGIKDDMYFITVPSWVTANKSQVSINAKSGEMIDISLQPTQKGRTYFNVSVVSLKDPSISKVFTSIVDAQECRGVAVVISPSESSVCQGVDSEFTIYVKNLGTIQDTFNLTTTAGALDVNKVIVNPGETKELKLRVGNFASPGNYTAKVRAQSGDVMDESEAQVVVENCYSATMDIAPQNHSVCFNAAVNYTVAIKNTGKLSDSYTFKVESVLGNITKQFSIGPGQVRMEYFTIQVSSDPLAGDHDIKVTLSSSHTFVSGDAMLSVKPKSSCYSVQIISVDDRLIPICNASTLPVIIKNTGEKSDRYSISLDAPSWAYVSPNSVELSGGQQQEIYLYFSPCYGVEQKVYEIKVRASSPTVQLEKTIAMGVSENVTSTGSGGNVTLPGPGGNQTVGGNVTGLILGLDSNTWKIVAISIITIIIIVILAIRFILLAKK